MAVAAGHAVDVVRALRVPEGRVHRLDVDAAVRQARVALGARGAGPLPVLRVAGEAAEALVDAHRRPVVAREHLVPRPRRVALVAERLPPVRARAHESLAFPHRRQGKPLEPDRARGCAGRRRPATAARSPARTGRRVAARAGRHRLAPSRWIAWQVRHGIAGRLAYSGFTSVHGPLRSSGVTRSPMPPSKCMPWQRRQSSISCWLALCSGFRKMPAYGVPCGPPCHSANSCRWQAAQRSTSGRDVCVADADLLRHLAPRVPPRRAAGSSRATARPPRTSAVALAAAHVAVARSAATPRSGADLVAARAAAPSLALVVGAGSREDQDEAERRQAPRARRAGGASLVMPSTLAAQSPAAPGPRSAGPRQRKAMAMIVSTGLKPPLVTCTLPSITNTLCTSWTRQLASTTEVFGSLPMRQVPAWCWPPLSAAPGTLAPGLDRAGFLQPGLGPLRPRPGDLDRVRVRSPERRATGMPQWSFTFGSSLDARRRRPASPASAPARRWCAGSTGA